MNIVCPPPRPAIILSVYSSCIGISGHSERGRCSRQSANKQVGENYHDHVASVLTYELVPGEISFDTLRDPKIAEQAMQEYAKGNSGLMAYTSNFFVHLSFAQISSETEMEELIRNATTDAQCPCHAKQMTLMAKRITNMRSTDVAFIVIPAYGDVSKMYEVSHQRVSLLWDCRPWYSLR